MFEPLTIETAPVSVSVRVAGKAGAVAKTVEAATAMMMISEICLTYFLNFLPQ
jgi:hypothetical protein